ncbi:hypothetical protein GCM10009640_11340 [Agrococcus citreus]|uniref:Uncharacterized protein n=1 Tax=Agrococcus citreus TaxID=84643 RepID=A0ABN1YRU1_9MICO
MGGRFQAHRRTAVLTTQPENEVGRSNVRDMHPACDMQSGIRDAHPHGFIVSRAIHRESL